MISQLVSKGEMAPEVGFLFDFSLQCEMFL